MTQKTLTNIHFIIGGAFCEGTFVRGLFPTPGIYNDKYFN